MAFPLSFLFLVSTAAATTPESIISDTHARSRALRRDILHDWTLPPQGYFATFAASPIQAITAALFLNDNHTAVTAAHKALAQIAQTGFDSCYEWTTFVRVLAMFGSRSDFPATARMEPTTEAKIKELAFAYAAKNGKADHFCDSDLLPSQPGASSMCQAGSENLDIIAKTSSYGTYIKRLCVRVIIMRQASKCARERTFIIKFFLVTHSHLAGAVQGSRVCASIPLVRTTCAGAPSPEAMSALLQGWVRS